MKFILTLPTKALLTQTLMNANALEIRVLSSKFQVRKTGQESWENQVEFQLENDEPTPPGKFVGEVPLLDVGFLPDDPDDRDADEDER